MSPLASYIPVDIAQYWTAGCTEKKLKRKPGMQKINFAEYIPYKISLQNHLQFYFGQQ